ncbi:MAG: adenylyltransferase/cytidyltransferase family protein [Candidatus Nanohaloarchaea archaeon]
MKAGFLGRFQPFHLGHYNVVDEEKDNYEDFTVIVGSPERSRTERNPLTFEERKNLIKACFPEVKGIGIEDTEEKPQESDPETSENQKWAEEFKEKGFDVIISGNDKVKEIIEKHTDIQVERPEMFSERIYSGTEVRRRINSGEEWRYLTPKCSHEVLEGLLEKVKKSGTQYNFEPGWKKDNAYHGTAEK